MQLGTTFVILHQLIARKRIRPAVRQTRLHRPQRRVVFASEGLMFVIQGLMNGLQAGVRQRRFFGLPAAGEICPDVFFESYIFAVRRNEILPGTRGGNSPGMDGL